MSLFLTSYFTFFYVSLYYLLGREVILLFLFLNFHTTFICGWFTTFTIYLPLPIIFFSFIIFIFLVVAFLFFWGLLITLWISKWNGQLTKIQGGMIRADLRGQGVIWKFNRDLRRLPGVTMFMDQWIYRPPELVYF